MMSLRAAVLTLALGACGGGGGFPDAPLIDSPPPGGTFSLAWTVTGTSGQPVSCEQIGAQTVTLVLRNHAVQGGTTEVFTCGSRMGTTPAIPPGTYDVDFELTGTAGLLATAPKQVGVVVTSGETTALEPIAFEVEAVGALELTLSSNQPAGNCSTVSMMGAGITSTTITLASTAGICQPVTFAISAGATRPAGTYLVNCGSPAIAPCIETDQKLTVSNVPSGGYTIRVRGQIGATDCYSNDDTLMVPPLGTTLVRQLNFAKLTAPGC